MADNKVQRDHGTDPTFVSYVSEFENLKEIDLQKLDLKEIDVKVSKNKENVIESIELLIEKLTKWKEQDILCGITGASGSGKSSLINSLRDLKPTHSGAAKVDSKETTYEPTPYRHPNNPKIVFYDLPGVGTKNWPQKSYLEKVTFDRYDCFIIVSKDRFTELDIWLAEEIRARKKDFFFVRTNLDCDVANGKRDYEIQETAVVEKIRDYTMKKIKEHVKNPEVFLIANPFPDKYDFQALKLGITRLLLPFQQEAMLLSISATSEEIILAKKKTLAIKTDDRCVLSALAAIPGITIPIFPYLSKRIDKYVISSILKDYQEQLGLPAEDLDDPNEIAKRNETKNIITYNSIIDAINEKDFLTAIVPILRTHTNYYAVKFFLLKKLDEYTKIAIERVKGQFKQVLEQ